MKTSTRSVEDGSTKFHHVGAVEFWLTPMNRVFLLVDGKPVFPSLSGSTVIHYDDPAFRASREVEEDLRRILRKQREIRMQLPTTEEDEIAFAYS